MSERDNVDLRGAVAPGELFARPKLRSGDLLALFWLARLWMLAAALPVLVAGFVWAARLPDRPVAETRLVVREGGGPAGQQVLLREGARLKAAVAARRAAAGPAEGAAATPWPEGALWVGIRRNRSDLALRLDGRGLGDPAGRLDRFLADYVATLGSEPDGQGGPSGASARDAGTGGNDPAVETAEAALREALAARQAFQAEHGFASFDAEIDRLNAVLRTADVALVEARTREAALDRRLAALDRRLEDTPERLPATAALPATGAASPLAALEAERADLLTRYTPDSVPVRAIDRRIEALQAQDAARGRDAADSPNPIHGVLLAERADLLAELAAARAATATLDRQRRAAAADVMAVSALEPEWRAITRDIERLEPADAVPGGPQAGAAGQLAREPVSVTRAGPVRLSDHAAPVRRQIRLASVALALLAALLAGIAHARSRTGFATPASAARTLNRPVIAAIPRRR